MFHTIKLKKFIRCSIQKEFSPHYCSPSLSFTAAQATVLIFYTDANGITHCEVRHDLDDCGFANVNPAVDCFPWFSMTGGERHGSHQQRRRGTREGRGQFRQHQAPFR
jgi:hypothetical protein